MSNLFSKASIILTPTAYNTSRILSVKPLQIGLEELVTNGDFETNSDWTLGSNISISGGKLVFTNAITNTDFAQQGIVAPTGKTYKITFTVSDLNSGNSIKIRFPFQDTSVEENGTHTIFGVGTEANFIRITPDSPTGTFSIDNISVKEASDGDLEFTRATEATRVNPNNIIELVNINIPRIDFVSGSLNNHLLLEPLSTNLISFSEHLIAGEGGTSQQNGIETQFSALKDPMGGLNAVKYTNPGNNNASLKKTITAAADTNLVVSIFIKKTEETSFSANNKARLEMFSNTAATTASLLGDALNAAPIGKWIRYSASAVSDSDGGSVVCALRTDEAAIFDIFGYQCEAQDFLTSYIPTSGSTVTRNADFGINAGNSDLINSTEGVLYGEISALSDNIGTMVYAISDGTANNTLYVGFNSTTNTVIAQLVVGGVGVTNMNGSVSDRTDFFKVAILYKDNDHKMFINGTLVATDTSGNTPSAGTFDRFNFDLGQGSFDFFGNVKCITVFKEALTDSELECLTTI